jgi:hypothetical protein
MGAGKRTVFVLSLSLSHGHTRMENHTRINAGNRRKMESQYCQRTPDRGAKKGGESSDGQRAKCRRYPAGMPCLIGVHPANGVAISTRGMGHWK